jgi:PAS domain S-box-containing protein
MAHKMDNTPPDKNIFSKLRDRIVDFLIKLEPKRLIAIGVIFAIVFSQLIVFMIGMMWSGKVNNELLFAAFLTPLIDAFLILTFFVAIIGRLKAAEARFAAFMKYMPGAAFLKRSSGEFVYVNETWERVSQMKGKDIYGKRDEDLWPEDVAASYKTNDETVMKAKIPLQFMQPVPQNDGLHNWYTIKFPIFGDTGSVAMLGGIGIDVTEREHLERELHETERRFKLLVDTMNEGTAITDAQGVIRYVNKKTCDMLGYAERELIGRSAFDFLDMRNREIVQEELAKRSLGQKGRYEASWTTKSGSHCQTIMSAVPLFNERNMFEGSFVVITDITDRKKAEDELKNHREHLEELVTQRTRELATLNDQLRQSQKLEAIGILAGGIAHEFSNILATMKGSAYLIQKKLKEDSPLMKYAEQILSSIGKANNLSNGLLAFSRRQTISLMLVHFNRTISRMSNLLVQLIGEHIELKVMPAERDIAIMADSNQIEQVLVNLVTNARDAMPDGGKLTIRTSIMEMNDEFIKRHGYGIPGKYAVLTVTDTGTGIEEGMREKIFQPFFTTKMVGKGSGLGLAVTYGIVKQHNGFIDVESVPGEGTTFTIYLPAVDAEAVHYQGKDLSTVDTGAETILLAEDDPDTRATMSALLETMGYSVLAAGNGEEAIKVFTENGNRIQLVILDVRMPRKNGREVYDEIRKVYPPMKFLFMSGYTADIIDSYGIKEEGLNFISKTALPEEILTKIREILDKRERSGIY